MTSFLDGVTRVSDETIERLRRAWHDGWNGEDVETIMAPFAEDVVFASPFVSKLGDDPTKATIEGRPALAAYVAAALARTPGIRYTVEGVHVGTDTIVLSYTCHFPDGRPDKGGVDLMRVDGAGDVVEWRCHYATG